MSFPSASIERDNTHRTFLQADTAAVATGSALKIDPSIQLRERGQDVYLSITPAVQKLLQLEKREVSLGKMGEPTFVVSRSTASYSHNIPIGDRIYTTLSNRALLDRFIEKIKGLDPRAYGAVVLPHDRLQGDILHALAYTPGRASDIVLLRAAFESMRLFFTHYNDILQTALARRPELANSLHLVGDQTIENAAALAQNGFDAYSQVLTADQMIERASTWNRVSRQQQHFNEAADFFCGTESIDGNGLAASEADLRQLASGRVVFADLHALLKFAPVAERHFVRIPNLSLFASRGVILRQEEQVERWRYPGSRVTGLFYWENRGTRDQRQVAVVVAADGYMVEGNGRESFPEPISLDMRRDNQIWLDAMVRSAEARLAG